MKPFVLPAIAFVVCFAIGGGAGAVVMRPNADADSLAADSLAADSLAADSLHAGDSTHTAGDSASHGIATLTPNGAANDSVRPNLDDPHAADPAAPAASTPAPAPAGSVPRTTPVSTPGTTPRTTPPAASNTIASAVRAGTGATVSLRPDGTIGEPAPNAGPDYQRLARLLSKMGAREAAKTLEQLPPDQAAKALTFMADKAAAAVLAQLAPDKSAALLQAAIALVPKPVAP